MACNYSDGGQTVRDMCKQWAQDNQSYYMAFTNAMIQQIFTQ